jgi:hypothetical protein
MGLVAPQIREGVEVGESGVIVAVLRRVVLALRSTIDKVPS